MATIGGFTRAGSISRTVPNPSQQAPPGIVCGHGDPVIRLQVKNNGVNQSVHASAFRERGDMLSMPTSCIQRPVLLQMPEGSTKVPLL